MYNPLTRRSFLTGALSTLTLPLLISAVPRASRALMGKRLDTTAATGPKRVIFFYVPNGLHPGAFPNDGVVSVTSGSTDFTFPDVLQPLSAYRSSLLLTNNITNQAAIVPLAGDHARGTGAFLTCTTAANNAAATSNVSADQLIANAIGSQYPIGSLQVGTDPGDFSGQCDIGYSCTYTSVLSWKDAQTPLPNLTSAASLFTRMFGGPGSANPQTLEERNSVLDYATQDLQMLNKQLQASDQQKLDEYLTGLRALETQINFSTSCSSGSAPVDSGVYGNHVQQMIDTLVLGLKCNLSPVVTFMLGNGQSNRVYSTLNYEGAPLNTGHHSLTHDGSGTDVYNQLTLIEAWEMQQFAYLISKLQATPDTTGTLYDNTVLMLSSELANGEDHDHTNLPVILAGGANTASVFTPGSYVQQASGTPMSNLLVTLMNAFTPTTSFRDSTGALNLR